MYRKFVEWWIKLLIVASTFVALRRCQSVDFRLIFCFSYTVDITCVSRNVVTTLLDVCWLSRRWWPVLPYHIILATVVNCTSGTTLSRSSGAVSTQTTVDASTQSDRWTSATGTRTRALVNNTSIMSSSCFTCFCSFLVFRCEWLRASTEKAVWSVHRSAGICTGEKR